LDTFYKSSKAIKPFIGRFLDCGKEALHVEPKILFNRLRVIGKECEDEMFRATKGVNTHKGLIFSFAVICGAIGKLKAEQRLLTYKQLQDEIQKVCKDLVKKDLFGKREAKTNGERLYIRRKLAGIRDEAQKGYPTVFKHSLPFYMQSEQKYGEDMALKLTLLLIATMAVDSNLFARGGICGVNFVKKRAKELLHQKDIIGLDKKLDEFDKEMIEKNLSIGGSADLLCLTWFLSKVDL